MSKAYERENKKLYTTKPIGYGKNAIVLEDNRLKNLLLSNNEKPQNERLEKIKTRLKEKWLSRPAKYPKIPGRPVKPSELSRKNPETGEDLTFHHKFNCNKIITALEDAIAKKSDKLLEKLRFFALYKNFSKDFKDILFEKNNKKPTNAFVEEFYNFKQALVWSEWNGFFGPSPENRIDDPKKELDSHYDASGSMTPRTKLAHEIGADFKLNLEELTRKLLELPSKRVTEFKPSDWEKKDSRYYQKNNPNPVVHIVSPDLKRISKTKFKLEILTNNAVNKLSLEINKESYQAEKKDNLWSAEIDGLNYNSSYNLKIIINENSSKSIDNKFDVLPPEKGNEDYDEYNRQKAEEKESIKANNNKDEDLDLNMFGDD